MQNLLLGLGTALVSIAVVVFIAVNWSRLDATVQGLVLVGFTGVAAAVSVATARRRMPATAEAFGVVAVALGLADVHAIRVGLAPEGEALLFWAGGVAVVALGALALGRAARLQGATLLAALLAQVPLVLILGAYDPRPVVWQLAVLAQGAVVAVVVRRGVGPRPARIAAGASAAVLAGGMTLLLLGDQPFVDHWEIAVGAAAAAALVVLVGWLWRTNDGLVALCGALAATLSVVAVGAAVAEVDDRPELVGAVVGMVAGVGLVGLVRLPRRVGLLPSLVVGAIAVASTLPLVLAAAATLVAASDAGGSGWGLDQQVRSAVVEGADIELDAWIVGLQLLTLTVLAALGVASGAAARRHATWIGVGVGGLALVVAPLVVPVTVGGLVAVSGVLAVAAAGWTGVAVRRAGERGPAAAAALLAGSWALTWSTVELRSALVVLATLTVASIVVTVIGLTARDGTIAAGAALLSVAGTAATAGVAVGWAGESEPWSWVAAAVASMAAAMVAVLLVDPADRREEPGRTVLLLVESASGWIHLLALIVVAPVAGSGPLTAVLATGAIGFSVLAARPSRRWLGIVAAAEALLVVWVQLAALDVTLVEAYTLPLAAVLLAVGIVVDRRAAHAGRPLASWATLSAGIAVGLGPTVVLSITDPGSLRPLIGLVGGAAVLVVGAVTGRRVAVDLGAAAVAVLGIRQLAPWVGSLPNWMVIGATGVVLLVVGATFEQRRRDAREVRRRYSSLR